MKKIFLRQLHVSWLIMWLTIGVTLGIASAAVFHGLPVHGWWVCVAGLIGFLWSFHTRSLVSVLVILIVGFIFGYVRGDFLQQSITGYSAFYGNFVTVSGIVNEDVTVAQDGSQRLQIRNITIGAQKLPGNVWVQTPSQKPIKRSDAVSFQGKLSEGFGTLPAAMYRVELVRVERIKHSDMGRDVRDWFAENVRSSIAEPEASLGIGYLVGQRSTLPEKLDDQLRLLGLTHVVVASGYNLTILIRFTRRLFARVSKYAAFTAAIMMVAGFVLMTGFSPSMSRAALVTGLSLVAWYFGRSIQPLVLLALVGAVTCYINPFFVWGDIGWYLSMLSFAGVMILAPLIRHYFFGGEAQLGTVASILIETTSAQIVTLPLILYIFGQYSPLALFANVLILPFIPFAMLAVFIAGVTVIFIPHLATLIHWPATIILRYMTKAVDIIAAMPGALGEFSFGASALIASYALLIWICVKLQKKTKHNFGQENIVL